MVKIECPQRRTYLQELTFQESSRPSALSFVENNIKSETALGNDSCRGLNAPTSGQWYALWERIHHDSSRFIQYKSIRLYTSRACGLMLQSTCNAFEDRVYLTLWRTCHFLCKRLLHEPTNRHFARPGWQIAEFDMPEPFQWLCASAGRFWSSWKCFKPTGVFNSTNRRDSFVMLNNCQGVLNGNCDGSFDSRLYKLNLKSPYRHCQAMPLMNLQLTMVWLTMKWNAWKVRRLKWKKSAPQHVPSPCAQKARQTFQVQSFAASWQMRTFFVGASWCQQWAIPGQTDTDPVGGIAPRILIRSELLPRLGREKAAFHGKARYREHRWDGFTLPDVHPNVRSVWMWYKMKIKCLHSSRTLLPNDQWFSTLWTMRCKNIT